MIDSASQSPRAIQVDCTDEDLVVLLCDGRLLSVPLAWFPRLAGASRKQLHNIELLGDGEGIHWPSIDEDLSVRSLVNAWHSVRDSSSRR